MLNINCNAKSFDIYIYIYGLLQTNKNFQCSAIKYISVLSAMSFVERTNLLNDFEL